jgi:hypothetical protein
VDTTLTTNNITPEALERMVRRNLHEEWVACWPAWYRAKVEAEQAELEAAWLEYHAEVDA